MNSNQTLPNTIAYASYWIGLFFVISHELFYELNYSKSIFYPTYALYVGLFFLLVKIILSSYIMSTDSILVLLLIISGAGTYFSTGDIRLFSIFFLVIASVSIPYKSIVKFFTFTLLTFYTVNLFFLVNHIIPAEYLYWSNFSGHTDVYRYCLGLGHPNGPALLYSFTIISLVATYKEKLHPLIFIICCIAEVIIYKLTDSRGGLLTFLTLFILYAIGFTPLRQFILKKRLFFLIDFLLPASMFCAGLLYKGNTLESTAFMRTFVDRIMHLRINLDNPNFHLSPFGSQILIHNPDSSYYSILLSWGIVGLVTFIVLFGCILHKAKNDYFINACITSSLISYFFEKSVYFIIYSFLLLYLFASTEEKELKRKSNTDYSLFFSGLYISNMCAQVFLLFWQKTRNYTYASSSWLDDLCHVICIIALYILIYCLVTLIIQMTRKEDTEPRKKDKTTLVNNIDQEFREP